MFPDLNLPKADLRLSRKDNQILVYDILRKKEVVLTPEEWVRQHLLHYLVHHLKYPTGLISVERGLDYNDQKKRTDIRVYENTGKVFMLIECKAPEVSLGGNIQNQLAAYNASLDATYIVISNGIQHGVFRKKEDVEPIAWEVCKEFPSYQ
ncbi:MAG: type I restriction enzyme HsdR N-terminal domain-containing protein [Cytophagaceae bacterium]